MTDPGGPPLRFGVLGPLGAWRGDSAIDLGPVQQRVVLRHPGPVQGGERAVVQGDRHVGEGVDRDLADRVSAEADQGKAGEDNEQSLAEREGVPAITGDRSWVGAVSSVEVRLFR